jgi:predicted AAA+ superfamily ATPase
LRRGTNINLLPGRLIGLKLDPITIAEFPGRLLEDILLYGSLPGIIEQETVHREADLESYVTLYLEEEVRAEAIVRNLGLFARFLEYAAAESGKLINFRKLSNEIGVAHTTIASYFQILEDCLIIERIEPITASATRKKLIQTQKFLFFDLGVRRTAAREGPKLPRATMGFLFEQFIGIELIRNARFHGMKTKVRFWRDPNGPEVDWVIEKDDMFIPIEVKLTDAPSKSDTRHLTTFIEEYKNAPKGYIVCQTPRQITLTDKISAIPWQDLQMLF